MLTLQMRVLNQGPPSDRMELHPSNISNSLYCVTLSQGISASYLYVCPFVGKLLCQPLSLLPSSLLPSRCANKPSFILLCPLSPLLKDILRVLIVVREVAQGGQPRYLSSHL